MKLLKTILDIPANPTGEPPPETRAPCLMPRGFLPAVFPPQLKSPSWRYYGQGSPRLIRTAASGWSELPCKDKTVPQPGTPSRPCEAAETSNIRSEAMSLFCLFPASC